ncbi:hypothetical protein TSAR_008115 [Trichomalopsis sarcophagae]|uniref:N-acetyltransferase domain-containing protein n=1 Tax=Trichomalopsis sarcophagae TaxID=543379 RepID=A0A232EU67_9HYME|nr:hypothetical protein TSAR_008115 [Trichomalopsis sarcophagae]
MNGFALNSSTDINLFKRRSSLFKPTLDNDDVLKQSLSAFIQSHREQELTVSDAPITWERLSTGYRIVDCQVHRTEELLELLKAHYFCSNHSCASSTLYIDSNTINKYQKFILDLISNSNSFCAIEEGTGEIVGVAMTKITLTEEENYEEENRILTSKDVFNVLKLEKALLKEAKSKKTYQFDKYCCIHVVCVKPKYYGKGIGTSLVRACLSKAQEQQCPLCIGIFSAGPSQTIAQRFGFEILAKMPWINVKTSKNKKYHPHVESSLLENSFVTCMGLLLPSNKNINRISNKSKDESTYGQNIS